MLRTAGTLWMNICPVESHAGVKDARLLALSKPPLRVIALLWMYRKAAPRRSKGAAALVKSNRPLITVLVTLGVQTMFKKVA